MEDRPNTSHTATKQIFQSPLNGSTYPERYLGNPQSTGTIKAYIHRSRSEGKINYLGALAEKIVEYHKKNKCQSQKLFIINQ